MLGNVSSTSLGNYNVFPAPPKDEFAKPDAVKGTSDGHDTVEMLVKTQTTYRDRFSSIKRSEGSMETKAPSQEVDGGRCIIAADAINTSV